MNTFRTFCPTGQHFYDYDQTCATSPPDCPTPGDQYNPATGQCEAPPAECLEPDSLNPTTGICESCPEARYATQTIPEYGMVAGECMAPIDDCVASRGMVTVDQNADSSGSQPKVVGCSPPPPNGCTNVTGKLEYNEFDYCQERQQECTQTGGTYGAIGSNGSVTHVCILNGADPLPTCSSGSQYYYEDSFGSSFACTPTTPPNDVCDSQKYDCDDDGYVDDQDGDGCTDNGTLNNFESCAPSWGVNSPSGPGSGTGLEGGLADSETNIGEDLLDPAVDGAGDCDPTSQNYQDCIGKGSAIEAVADAVTGSGSSIVNPYDGSSDVSDSTSDYYTGLSSVPILSAFDNWSTVFSGSGECPQPNFDAFGETFTISYHCTLYNSISGPLSLVMLSVWIIAGGRHLMSA
jgi:hypothetical protein